MLPEDEDDDNSFLENSPFAKILEPYEDKTVRYIDVDKLKAVIRKFYPNDLEILEQIDNAAVEDIQPVIHANGNGVKHSWETFWCVDIAEVFHCNRENAVLSVLRCKMNIRGVQCEL